MSISTTVSRSIVSPPDHPGGQESVPATDAARSKLMDCFPSEIVAFYTALLGLPFRRGAGETPVPAQPLGWQPEHGLYLVSVLLTVALVVFLTRRKLSQISVDQGNAAPALRVVLDSSWRPAAIAVMAFSIWAFALPASQLQEPLLHWFILPDHYDTTATIISGSITSVFAIFWQPANPA